MREVNYIVYEEESIQITLGRTYLVLPVNISAHTTEIFVWNILLYNVEECCEIQSKDGSMVQWLPCLIFVAATEVRIPAVAMKFHNGTPTAWRQPNVSWVPVKLLGSNCVNTGERSDAFPYPLAEVMKREPSGQPLLPRSKCHFWDPVTTFSKGCFELGFVKIWLVSAIQRCLWPVSAIQRCLWPVSAIQRCLWPVPAIQRCLWPVSAIQRCLWEIFNWDLDVLAMWCPLAHVRYRKVLLLTSIDGQWQLIRDRDVSNGGWRYCS